MQVHSSLEDFVKDAERFCPLAGIFRLTRPFQKCILYSSRFSFIIYISQNRQSKHHGLCPTRYAVSGRAGEITAFF